MTTPETLGERLLNRSLERGYPDAGLLDEAAARLAELERENTALKLMNDSLNERSRIDVKEIDALAAQCAVMVGALRPFAETRLMDQEAAFPDDWGLSTVHCTAVEADFTLGDLRRALAMTTEKDGAT